ncbi:MAG: hypothetical protein R3B84_12725 [Zavarzinella sp.]
MIRFNQDPHKGGYAYLPLKSVTGNFQPDFDLQALLSELQKAGFAEDRIEIFSGKEGAEVLDLDGKHHGLWVRFVRGLEEYLFDDMAIFQRANEVLQAGGTVVAVFTHGGESDWRQVGAILKQQGATDITHWGKWVTETLN